MFSTRPGRLPAAVEDRELIDQVVTKDPAPIATELGDSEGREDSAHAPRQYPRPHRSRGRGTLSTTSFTRLRDAGAEIVEIDFGEEFLKHLPTRQPGTSSSARRWGAISAFLRDNAIPTSSKKFTGTSSRV